MKNENQNQNQNEDQRIDLRTMRPIGEAKEQYLQEYEKERKRYEKEQQRKRDERINNLENPIAKIYKTIAWVVVGICGLIGAMIIMAFLQPEQASSCAEYGTCLGDLINYLFMFGSLLLALFTVVEIIQILHDIRAKIYKK